MNELIYFNWKFLKEMRLEEVDQEWKSDNLSLWGIYYGLPFETKGTIHINVNLNVSIFGVVQVGFPGGSDSKESTCSVGDLGSIPGLRRTLGEGNGCPLQYSCLENPTD